ncbi:MAG: DUF2145 domain-containing protein [Rhodoferax sp.]|nr:DUF2145 domain-containing protein [Rhodoferax sp.]MBP9685085.1 DUF2145 domain-containing protein [Rhodoferax sp.]
MKQLLTATMLATMALVSPPALAGRTCETPQPPKVYTVKRALTLAERTLKALDSSGAKVVVLTRAGQDLSQYGLRYSHLGLAYRQEDAQGGHVWRVLHKLNQCGTADSALYRQGLGEFFLDDLWRFEAAWVVPTEPVQAKLLALLQDEPRALQLHHQPYSMVSYAWGQKYQQSNQWAIETMSLALSPAMANGWGTRKQAQNWLHSQGYQPTSLHIGPFTRLGARVTAANVAFDDHPTEKRFSDRIETVTVDSVFDWLMQSGLGHTLVKLPPN